MGCKTTARFEQVTAARPPRVSGVLFRLYTAGICILDLCANFGGSVLVIVASSPAPQEAMAQKDAGIIPVFAHDVAAGVDRVGASENSAREINRSEAAVFVFPPTQQKAIVASEGIRTRGEIAVTPHDVATRVDPKGNSAGSAKEVKDELGMTLELAHYVYPKRKAVGTRSML